MLYIIAITTVILLLLIILCKSDNNIEGYDERMVDTNFEKCARFCKGKAGCFGFAYDQNNQICYPSKSSLIGRPVDDHTLFKDEYNPDHAVCNKADPIIPPIVDPPFNQRRMNSIYACSEKEGLQPQWYLHSHKKFDNIGEGRKIDEIFDIDTYNVVSYNWPISKYDAERIDYLLEQRRKQTLNSETITSLSRMENTIPVKSPDPPIKNITFPVPPKIKPLDFGLEGVRSFAKEIVREASTFPKRSRYDILEQTPVLENFEQDPIIKHNYVYNRYDDFNAGEYLGNYKCASGIKLKPCLDYCSSKESCVAAEYNPKFGNRKDICCPFRTIGKFEPRQPFHKDGRFYVKDVQNQIDVKSGTMIKLKQNAVTKDIIYTCQIGGSA
jgi:hypothetical protein